jgi:citrate lyase subunit beta / citryl-CoA lyase
MPCRSYLFVPGNRPERFAKACASGADVVIVDLEDAVPDGQKSFARDTVASWLSADRPVHVRVNGTNTAWFEEDVAAILRPGVAGVVFPKAEGGGPLAALAALLPDPVRILPIVETAAGVWNVLEIASSPKVERLAFGALDFQLDTGITGEGEELLYARSRIVLASRVAGVFPPLDGVTTGLDDADALASDIRRARRLGFGGKLCIHPKQVAAINEGFLPTEREITWAKGVLEAAFSSGEGASRRDGKMIDRPVIEQAKRILERVSG